MSIRGVRARVKSLVCRTVRCPVASLFSMTEKQETTIAIMIRVSGLVVFVGMF